MAQQTTVRTRTSAQTRIAVAAAGLLLLGLGAYGFGFVFGANVKQNSLSLAPTSDNTPLVTAPQQCNTLPITAGGGGRCYPGCNTDSDCSDASTNGQVATWDACQKTAATLCGNTANCIAQVCGPQKPVCTTKKTCSRPQFSLTEAQCAGQEQIANTNTPIQNTCEKEKGGCYSLCAQDSDCIFGQDVYEKCVANNKTSCTTKTATGNTVDISCLTKRCGNQPTAPTGSCIPASNNIPAHCAMKNSATTPAFCAQGSTEKANNVWIGSCANNNAPCINQTNCTEQKTNKGTWVGLCPHKTTSEQPIINCTNKDTSACPPEEKPTTPKQQTSDKPQQ